MALIVPSGVWGQSVSITISEVTTTINAGDDPVSFGSGTVSLALKNDLYTLTFNNATIGSTESVASVTWNGTDNLTVDIVGTNTLYGMLTTSGQSEVFPTLTFANTSSSSCSLRILCSDGAFSGFNNVVYDGVYLHTSTPYDYSCITPQDLSGSVISDITISSEKCYPIWIGSTQITSTNSSDVLGDEKVSYKNNILNLNAATVGSVATQSDLTIHTVGECDRDG